MTPVSDRIRNGVDTKRLDGTLDAMKAQPELGSFQFRAINRWIAGSHTRTTIRVFYGGGRVDTTREREFAIDGGEPAILPGDDSGPTPPEYVLHALAACLTTSLILVAAALDVRLTEVRSTLVGDIDARGALGLSEHVHNGRARIGIAFIVKGDASEARLRDAFARALQRSAVYDVLTTGSPVTVDVTIV